MKKLLLILLCLPMIGFGQQTGCISGDCQNGKGTFTNKEGTYTGYWENGKPHGQGKFVANSYTYTGEYSLGEKEKGTMTYSNGDKHVGQWKNGKRHGRGTYTWKDGEKKTGTWIAGKYKEPSKAKKFRKNTWEGLGYIFDPDDMFEEDTDRCNILTYDLNNQNPWNFRYSGMMDTGWDYFFGFYTGGSFKVGRGETSSLYKVQNGEVYYLDELYLGQFGPRIEEDGLNIQHRFGLTRYIFSSFWLSVGLAYEYNLVVEKREYLFDNTVVEWIENKDKTYEKVFMETDIYVKLWDGIALTYGIVYGGNGIHSSAIGVGLCW